ncbi:MAG: peptidylprolyl isomerase [Bryobacteraceae bacterium]
MKAVFSFLALAGLLLAQPSRNSTKKNPRRGSAVSLPLPGAKPAAAKPASATPSAPALTADHVVATLNGKPVTAGAVENMLHGAPPIAMQSARNDPKNFLIWSNTMQELAALAEKNGLQDKTPHKDRLQWTHNQVLMMAAIEKQKRDSAPSEAEAKAWYEDNAANFGSARTRLIYVAELEGKEAEAKAKLDRVLAKLKSGADFAAVARAESDDDMTAPTGGDFPPIDKTSKIHPDIRKTIFHTKPGAYTEPVKQVAGYYIFQTVAIDLKPFEEVKQEIIGQLGEQRTDLWMAEQRRQAEVKLLNDNFFKVLHVKSLAEQGGLGTVPDSGEEIKPDTVLATMGGKNLTAEEFTGLMMAVPPQVRTNAMQQPMRFLQEVTLMRNLTAMAESQGLDKQQPFLGRLRYNRNEILTQAAVDDYNNNIVVGPDAPKQEYDSSLDRFRFAKVRALYVAFSLTPPPQTDPNAKKILNEEEARLRAEELLKDIRAGADFATTVKDYSDDEGTRERGGELPPITATDPKVPDAIKQPVFAAKAGDVIGPVKLSNGFYLVKVEESGIRPFEQVKDQIYEELRAKRFQAWFDGVRGQFQVEITDPAAFQQVVGPAKTE